MLEMNAMPNCGKYSSYTLIIHDSGYGKKCIECPDYRGEFIHQLDKS